ncbi:TIM barrel protein [Candidatus Micrarchaeota archaeon]|nr:TIM barrel protein [Candidatus Micrarchaeota archaeon]
MPVRFSPAGVPAQCKGPSTLEGVVCCHELGLGGMEVQFGRGVKGKEEYFEKVGEKSRELDVYLSSHAPYYINMCNKKTKKKSIRWLLDAAKATQLMNGRITVFHPGAYMGMPKEEAFKTAVIHLKEAYAQAKDEGIKKVKFGAETVGKLASFGHLDEILKLYKEAPNVKPVIDWAHLLATGTKLNKEADYREVIKKVEKTIPDYFKDFHFHFSEINYTEKGERNHLVLGTKNKPSYKILLKIIKEHGYSGTVVCETPEIDKDALKMQKYYKTLK